MVIYVGVDSNPLQNITRAASPGQTVLLPCLHHSTETDWLYQRDTQIRNEHRTQDYNITSNGVVSQQYADRFQLHPQGLLITDVQSTDHGTYTCVDHHQRLHHRIQHIRLFVPCESTFYRL